MLVPTLRTITFSSTPRPPSVTESTRVAASYRHLKFADAFPATRSGTSAESTAVARSPVILRLAVAKGEAP